MARLPSSMGLPRPGRLPPREEARPRPRRAMVGATVCLRGRPRPCLGTGEPGPSRGAFPFSAAENFLRGAIGGTGSNGAEKQASEEEMGNGGSATSPFIAREGQPAFPTIVGNDGFPCMSQGLVKPSSSEAAWGSGDAHVQSTATRRPRP